MTKVKLLSDQLHLQVLGRVPNLPSDREVREMQANWKLSGLQDATDVSANVELPLPSFCGLAADLLEDASAIADDYMSRLDRLSAITLVKPPQGIPCNQSGWMRWTGKTWQHCQRPADGSTMVADFETVKNGVHWYPTTCVCYVLDKGWYVWQWASHSDLVTSVSIGQNQVIVGHNVPYDRSYFSESYRADDSNYYFDTMGAFIAVRGMSNQQIGAYKSDYYSAWSEETASKGLASVYNFYTKKTLEKTTRDNIITMTPKQMWVYMPQVLPYCLEDIMATHEVFTHVYPELKMAQPSKTSFSGQMLLGQCWLPLSTKRFPEYYNRAETVYNETMASVLEDIRLAYEAFKAEYGFIADEDIPQHLQWLDWTRGLSGKTKGQPKWLRTIKTEDVTMASRIAVAVLRMTYKGLPLYWEKHPTLKTESGKPCEGWRTTEAFLDNFEDADKALSFLFSEKLAKAGWFDAGILDSTNPLLRETVAKVITCVNWTGLRSRVAAIRTESPEGFPVCVPAIVTTGTISRRAADSTWQCAPNAKKGRIGTELKTMIEAPKGYKIVGADIDGQEAWIASLFSDTLMGYCGSSSFGLTMLVGIKSQKTDVHSVIATLAGIGRTLAKNIFYGMLYGLGAKGVFSYIRKSNAAFTDSEVQEKTNYLIRMVKGVKRNGKWVDGLGSDSFNYMERLVSDAVPRTPVLGAALSLSLSTSGKDFMTTKINWCIQSSGVDMRDILLTLCNYFFKKLNVKAKLLMPIHDEVRYLVPDSDVSGAAYALQLAHLYTRAIYIEAFGLDGIPQACAWFSGVDVDHVWRKVSSPDPAENGDDNAEAITPSQDAILPYGYTLNPSEIEVPF